MLSKNIKIKIYKEFSKDLESLWKDFEKKSDNYFFQTCKWQKYWFYQTCKYKKLSISIHVVIVEYDNEILFILPMYINKFSYFKILMWSGFPYSDYNSPLIKKGLNINKYDFLIIWNCILANSNKSFNCINLNNQPELINNIQNPFSKHLGSISTNSYSGIFLDDITEIKNILSKSQKEQLKLKINRLSRKGNLTFNTAKNKKDKIKVIKFIIKNKSSQYNKTRAWNLFDNNVYKKIFILSSLKLSTNSYIGYLSLDNRIIAAHSGYIYNKTCYYLFPAYDDNYEKYSPGKILLNKLMEDCKIKKISYFDFTIGSEDYKKKWANNKMNSSTVLKSINLIGFIYVLSAKLKIIIGALNFKRNIFHSIYNKVKNNVG